MEEKVRRRLERTKLLEEQEDDGGAAGAAHDELSALFTDSWCPLVSAHSPATVLRSHHSPSALDVEGPVAIALANGSLGLLDLERLSDSGNLQDYLPFSHKGLSDVRCSNAAPGILYSSSVTEGNILVWDGRTNGKSPVITFTLEKGVKIGGGGSETKTGGKLKPILTFDVSGNDGIVCGGTEVVDEDSYLLFWDVRSSKLLGAYWESHSDDVTAVKFHPSATHSLTTGSTDGLLNVFNLLESSEDDALLYSFNTESSVESLAWTCSQENGNGVTSKNSLPASTISAVTHTNEVQLWDATSGDQFCVFDRNRIAGGMMMKGKADAVYVTGCYVTSSTSSNDDDSPLGMITSSVTGGACRFLGINGNQLTPKGVFPEQKTVVLTAQFLPKFNRWLTCDDDGLIKVWRKSTESQKQPPSLVIKETKVSKKPHKEKPYSRRKTEK